MVGRAKHIVPPLGRLLLPGLAASHAAWLVVVVLLLIPRAATLTDAAAAQSACPPTKQTRADGYRQAQPGTGDFILPRIQGTHPTTEPGETHHTKCLAHFPKL